MRVHFVDGEITTLYPSIGSPLAVDHGQLVDGRSWAGGRRALSRKGNFLSTCISHGPCFRGLGSPSPALMISAVLPSVVAEAALVTSARQPMAGRLSLVAAVVSTVLLAAEVPAADVERPRAPAAGQLVERNGVHPAARTDRN
jgi:hypothetical protein